MADKQPHLNGAYYGPSIPPPPPKSYHRPGRGGGCGCCCGCLFSMLFSCIFQLLCTIVVIIGIAVFVFWLIVRPNQVKFHVTDASLTQFNYSSSNGTLYYNLALNITIRNPNKRLGIYYDNIEARALYQDARFDSENIPPFYQGHKTTNVVSPVFKGQQLISLGSDETSEFNKENSSGVYDIDVKLYMRIRFKLGVFKTGKFKPKVKCDLKVPLSGKGSFETTKCDYDL